MGILDFVFDEDRSNRDVVHFIQLKNQLGQVFYDKLTFIYLTLPHFNKTLAELETAQDKWFYIFRHLHELQEIPPVLNEAVFIKLFEAAQIACFNPSERQAYEDSLKYYRDLKNVTDTAWEEGKEESGRNKALEIARNLLDVLDDVTIALKTGLSEGDVQQLRQQIRQSSV